MLRASVLPLIFGAFVVFAAGGKFLVKYYQLRYFLNLQHIF